MKRVLLFASLVCYANCISLRNICKEDVFEFQKSKHPNESIPVNSFYRLRLDVRLPKIKEFYLGITEQPKFKNRGNYAKLTSLQKEYDRLFLGVYNPRFVENMKNAEIVSKRTQYAELERRLRELIDWGMGFDNNVTDWRNFHYQKMRKTESLLKNLFSVERELLADQFVRPSELELALSKLAIGQQQKLSFNGLFYWVYYSQPVTRVSGMTWHRASKLFFSPETSATIHLDVFVPFNNLNYEQELKNGECVKAVGLPAFYRNKNSPN